MAEVGLPGTGAGNLQQVLSTADLGSWVSSWAQDAVLDPDGSQSALEVYADASGMRVKVRPGAAILRGVRYVNDATLTVPIDPNPSAFPRRDLVALRLHLGDQKAAIVPTKGTPANSPLTPSAQYTSPVYELSRASVLVPAGAGTSGNAKQTIAASDVTPRGFTWLTPNGRGRGRIGRAVSYTSSGQTSSAEFVTSTLGVSSLFIPPSRKVQLTMSCQVAGSAGALAVVRVRESASGPVTTSSQMRLQANVLLDNSAAGQTLTRVIEFTSPANYGVYNYGVTVQNFNGVGLVGVYAAPDDPSVLLIDEVNLY